jgi:hypothetical protein
MGSLGEIIMTQDQLLQAFIQGGSPNAPPPHAATVAQLQQVIDHSNGIRDFCIQHINALYAEIHDLKQQRKWLTGLYCGTTILLILFLWAFFPIWQKYQRQSFSSPPSVQVREGYSKLRASALSFPC